MSGRGKSPNAGRAEALALTPVSAAAAARLDAFVAMLLEWQGRINLIAPSTVPDLWTRHIADSLQLLGLAPDARVWIDFGSGGGFPGLVLACVLADVSGATVHLVESNAKKAAFLREAKRVTGASATVHHVRIENFGDSFRGRADVVCARALAPLKQLCDQAFPFIARGAIGLFLKGQDVDAELTETAKYWNIQCDLAPSRTNPDGRIVIVRRLESHKKAR